MKQYDDRHQVAILVSPNKRKRLSNKLNRNALNITQFIQSVLEELPDESDIFFYQSKKEAAQEWYSCCSKYKKDYHRIMIKITQKAYWKLRTLACYLWLDETQMSQYLVDLFIENQLIKFNIKRWYFEWEFHDEK